MSLTSHLNNLESPIRQFLERKFPNNRPLQKAARPTILNFIPATIRPSDVIPYGTIGMALDYRIRYYFENSEYTSSVGFAGASVLHTNFWQDCERLLQEPSAQQQPITTTTDRVKRKRGAEAAVQFFVSLSNTINEIKPAGQLLGHDDEKNLCRHCVILALYEELARAGLRIQSPLFQIEEDTLHHLMAIPANHWIDDLCTLSWAFYGNFKHLLQCERVELNPAFCGSGDVGGADADIILDGCLIDIKTTMNPSLEKLWLYQLLGYVLLDYRDLYQIRSVGILYARQGFMLRWDLSELLTVICANAGLPDLAELRAEFQQMIAENRGKELTNFSKVKVSDQFDATRRSERCLF